MIVRILECCQHFVARRSLRLKLVVFDVMAGCVRFVRPMCARQVAAQAVLDGAAAERDPRWEEEFRPLITSDYLPAIATTWQVSTLLNPVFDPQLFRRLPLLRDARLCQ
jgi:hypothetical protein